MRPTEAAVKSCSVRIEEVDSRKLLGTGFLVSADKVVTCYHVSKERRAVAVSGTRAGVRWTRRAIVTATTPESGSDLALLELDEPIPDAVCAWLDWDTELRDNLLVFRYTELEPEGAFRQFSLRTSFAKDGVQWLGIDGRPDEGTSGAAILDERTRRICGVVNLNRAIGYGPGFEGAAISAAEIEKAFPERFELEFNSTTIRQSWTEAIYLGFDALLTRAVEHVREAGLEIGTDYQSVDFSPPTPSKQLIAAWEAFMLPKRWRLRCHQHIIDVLHHWNNLPDQFKPDPRLQESLLAIDECFRNHGVYGNLRRAGARLDERQVGQWLSTCERLLDRQQGGAAAIKDITERLRNCASSLSSFRAALREPYGIAFLLTGCAGAGKSMFLRFALREWVAEREAKRRLRPSWIPLVLRHPAARIDFGSHVLDEARRLTGGDWPDLKAMDSYLEVSECRFVVVVDGLHRWDENGTLSGQSLASTLSDLTEYDSLQWLFTTALQSIPRFNRPVVTFDRTVPNAWIELGTSAPVRGSGTPTKRTAEPLAAQVSGWHVVDDYNAMDRVGFGILASHGWKGEELGTSEVLRHREILNARPLFAVILCWLAARLGWQIADFATTSIPEFGEALDSWVESAARQDRAAADDSELDPEVLRDLVRLIFHLIIQSPSLEVFKRDLDAAVEANGVPGFRGPGPSLLRKAQRHLEQLGLLQAKLDAEPRTSRMIELGCDPFWEYRFGLELKEQLMSPVASQPPQTEALDRLIARANVYRLASGALQQLLILLDGTRDTRESRAKRRQALTGIVQSDTVAAFVPFFAGAYGSPQLQKRVLELVDTTRRLREPLDYLAFLFLGARLHADTYSPPTIVRRLQPHFESFAKGGFKDYLAYVLEKIIGDCRDQSQCAELLLALDYSEWSGKADSLARRAVEQVLRLWDGDVKSLLITVKRYVRRSTAPKPAPLVITHQSKLERAGIHDRWSDRTHFLHWMLHHTCLEVVNRKGIDAYRFLVTNNWYNPAGDQPKLGEERTPEEEWPAQDMEKFANFALADVVWRRGSRKDYVALLHDLMSSSNRIDLENAFFLIRHTEVIQSRNEVFLVDERFRPLLAELRLKKQIHYLQERFREFFEYNLHPPPIGLR